MPSVRSDFPSGENSNENFASAFYTAKPYDFESRSESRYNLWPTLPRKASSMRFVAVELD